ncbi:hypothetical protein MUO14_05700 [Halobacillus shinanisalinarum]|uniref:Uncharacterized protein n=1 Tax=Halobacillus shinanisalinarum TaxID=2932258 RepID=A0ABY4H207_9BACI|nr:hypothetical protein [Halobacillus shinanisalinarum]UOQ94448.1 hypothetical protein MUO14_05700 [Halobacillus shinanisalinarum]
MTHHSRPLAPIVKIWLDDLPTSFTHAFVERLDYEWMVEVVNPFPIPLIEDREYVLQISFEQDNGHFYPNNDIQSFDVSTGNEFTIYRFFMYPPT